MDREKTQGTDVREEPRYRTFEERTFDCPVDKATTAAGAMCAGDRNIVDKMTAQTTAGGTLGARRNVFEEIFRYHSPRADQLPKYAAINQAAKNFAEVIYENCPMSQDYIKAIDAIRLARMLANAAVALDGLI